MHLYHATLSRPAAVSCAATGNFSGQKGGSSCELAVASGGAIAIYRPDANGRLSTLCSVECFGAVRSLASFRLTKQPRDYMAVGSDSGKITILEYSEERSTLVVVHSETFGKTGVRRLVPGEFVTADPKGRALMIGALEKQKFVYVLNRDGNDKLTISSPLEAHKSHTLCMDLCALDCDFDNPVFAAIELNYSEADVDPSGEAALAAQKHLTLYELDLGLNHVVRKWSGPVDNGAYKLVQVPGGSDGPGGCLVCCDNFVIYRNADAPALRVVVPRRQDLPASRGVLITAATRHKQKSGFFFLLQSEYGDLYKVTLDYDSAGSVTDMKLKYFDTIPPAASLNLLIVKKTGFLFCASEYGNHLLYQFLALGDGGDDVEMTAQGMMEVDNGFQPVFFNPRPLVNLAPLDILESLSASVDMKVANLLKEEAPQIYLGCGAGSRSSLRTLRLGLTVTVMAQSPLPGNPSAVWTVKKRATDTNDAFIVVSFVNATLVLGVGETVEEVTDSGFLGEVSSKYIGRMGEDSLVQVHADGVRYIQPGKPVTDWRPPGRRAISKVAANDKQVVVALAGGEIISFEVDDLGQLSEKDRKEVSGEVACLAIADVPEDRLRARFLAVGSFDGTVRILSLDPGDLLQVLTVQALAAPPESLLLLSIGVSTLSLVIGLTNGILLRSEVDTITGQLADTKTRFLGARSPRLFKVQVQGGNALLALSTRPWLGYQDSSGFQLSPVAYEVLEYAAPFVSEQCLEGGFVAISGSSLHVAAIDKVDSPLNQATAKLRYTPRRIAIHKDTSFVVVAESEKGVRSVERRSTELVNKSPGLSLADATLKIEQEDDQFGLPRASAPGEYAGCLRVMNASASSTLSVAELPAQEAVTSLCCVKFEGESEVSVILGTAEGLSFPTLSCRMGYIRTYSVSGEGTLTLRHQTPVPGIPGALCGFRGMLLVGVGNAVVLFQNGKMRLLKKAEISGIPNFVQGIQVNGNRIYVADAQESVHFLRYRNAGKIFYIFADDVIPRHMSSFTNIDYDTIAGGDKFGSFFVLRVPQEVSDDVEDDPTGGKHVAAEKKLMGAPNKVETVAQFFVGAPLTSLQLVTFQPGGTEVILYSTITGALGVFIPFSTREEVDFFRNLEMYMRQESPPLCGRDHMAYRSSFAPVKETIDGDLCERFALLHPDTQQKIAEGIDHTTGEVVKKLEDIRALAGI